MSSCSDHGSLFFLMDVFPLTEPLASTALVDDDFDSVCLLTVTGKIMSVSWVLELSLLAMVDESHVGAFIVNGA